MSLPAQDYPAWVRSAQQVADDFKVDPKYGLTTNDVPDRRKVYGSNEFEKKPPTPIWKLLLEQFDDMLVKILLLAAFVSFVIAYFEEGHEEGLGAYTEPLVILLILILNAAVGVWQESNAQHALDALKMLQSETARVIRDGKMISDLPSSELVPGDIVELHVGDRVPADLRIITLRTATLRCEQSSLTGESEAVMKQVEHVEGEKCEVQAKKCMLFSGTAVANGSCIGIVTSVGMSTELGKIHSQIEEAAAEDDDTPLKKKLDEFGNLLAKVIFWICVLVWLINYQHFLSFKLQPGTFIPDPATIEFSLTKATYYFKIAVALAVAAIPEGLPAVITTCLALGTRTMAKKNAIVRKLPSVETLGCTSVICSDKTGTLTTNQMTVVTMALVDESAGNGGAGIRTIEVTGASFDPTDGSVNMGAADRAVQSLAEVCAVCSEAHIEVQDGRYKAVGVPTEAALKVFVEKLGLTTGLPQATDIETAEPVCAHMTARAPRKALLEFDRLRKSMSVLCGGGAKGNVLLVKGAAELVLQRCNRVMLPSGQVVAMTPAVRASVTKTFEDMAGKALRCLALARKDETGILADYNGRPTHPAAGVLADPNNYAGIESELVLLGLVGLMDPPRPEVKGAIAQCKGAGIRVIVITGDNKITAEAICKSIGVLRSDDNCKLTSFTGMDFAAMSHDQQVQVLSGRNSLVFSRAEPRHKQDIVRILKELGEVTAMTGDGVNDAPALKLADIGIAMGIAGTEVAKEASDMVLADDNFSTIVAAVSEGRNIFNNMKAFIRYMISSNIGEVASIFLTAALGLPEGLIPVQLLWVNLVTDGPPATALGFNPPDKDVMSKPPRSSSEQLITPWVFFRYMVIGVYVGIATVGAFVIWYTHDNFMGIDLSKDGHSTVTWHQLTHWQSCNTWTDFKASNYTAGSTKVEFDQPCEYFTEGKAKASTLSLSVLVAIEMLNALNALSEDGSLFHMPPWSNVFLLLAIVVSISLHCVILYVPFLASTFSIVPLDVNEWALVILLAFPVILLDEVLKLMGRNFFGQKKVKVD